MKLLNKATNKTISPFHRPDNTQIVSTMEELGYKVRPHIYKGDKKKTTIFPPTQKELHADYDEPTALGMVTDEQDVVVREYEFKMLDGPYLLDQILHAIKLASFCELYDDLQARLLPD